MRNVRAERLAERQAERREQAGAMPGVVAGASQIRVLVPLEPGMRVVTPLGLRTVVRVEPAAPWFPAGIAYCLDDHHDEAAWDVRMLRSCDGEVFADPGPVEKELWAIDPRPDLATDTAAWARLLGLAWDADDQAPVGVFGALQAVRQWGAGLELTERGSYRIVPGELSVEEYRLEREHWLMPHEAAVRVLLGALR